MPVFSRNMPSSSTPTLSSPSSVCAIGLLLGVLALPGLHWWPLALVGPAAFVLMTIFASYHDERIAKARSGESICDFARSFDRRRVDAWIIRAVYEEFSFSYQVRRSDRLCDDLCLDDEHLEEILEIIAKRIGRSLEDTETNPLFGNVETVGDFALFLQNQPQVFPAQ